MSRLIVETDSTETAVDVVARVIAHFLEAEGKAEPEAVKVTGGIPMARLSRSAAWTVPTTANCIRLPEDYDRDHARGAKGAERA